MKADYWFVSPRGGYKRHGYEITDEVLDRVGASLATIVDGIEAGTFASRPTVVSSSPFVECDACDPDVLGVTELRRMWERKRSDAALARYADFAEPSEPVEPIDALAPVDGGGDA